MNSTLGLKRLSASNSMKEVSKDKEVFMGRNREKRKKNKSE